MTVLVEAAPSALRSPPAPDDAHDLPAARGPVSQSVVDYVTGGRGDVVDASSGIAGQPHDDDFQMALWLLNVLQVATFDEVDPDRVASLRMRTLHWYLEQTFEVQLRRLVPSPAPVDLLSHLRSLRLQPSARQGALGWETEPHALALARLEPVLKPSVARLQSAQYGLGGAAAGSDLHRARPAELDVDPAEAVSGAPACRLAAANAGWLFARDRRMRGAAVGQLCLLRLDSSVVTDELVPILEEATPWLVADAAWGAAVASALQECASRGCPDGGLG